MEALVGRGGAPRGREDEADRPARERVGGLPRRRGLQIGPPARGEGEEGLLGAGAVAVVEGLSRSQEIDRLLKKWKVVVVVVFFCFLIGEFFFFFSFLFVSSKKEEEKNFSLTGNARTPKRCVRILCFVESIVATRMMTPASGS